MSNSLRDQLLGLGYKVASEPKPAATLARKSERASPRTGMAATQSGATTTPSGPSADPVPITPANASAADRKPARSREEMDLAKAYALRGEHEKRERIAAEKLKQEQARLRREAKAMLSVLLKDKALNDPAAEHVRHFDYGGKIKRVHVTAPQLQALNAGELGVLQEGGRYLLVSAAVLAEAEAIFAPAIALKVNPDAPATDDPYADPAYQVPDDLIW